MKKIIILGVLAYFFLLPGLVSADTLGDKHNFYIDSSYDLSKRDSVGAVLIKVSQDAYFYVDENWYGYTPQSEVLQEVNYLANQFDSKIYPGLTSAYGQEWSPGIDKDTRITVLIHPMSKGSGGYFRSNDEYYKVQVPGSNEREMVYLNTDYIKDPSVPSFLAHEFTHLIEFNQKNRIYSTDDDVWLNEMRAEYAPTLLGYDDIYEGSYLQNRVQLFSEQPFDSITEWKGQQEDYGVINIFAQYLVDQYGKQILIDSLHSTSIGIDSINGALIKNGYKTNFSQIFSDWTVAAYANDCSIGEKYCFRNSNLKSLHAYPKINFLPLSGQSVLSVTETTKDWAGNWFKIIGGSGDIKLDFVNNDGTSFTIPYLIQKSGGGYAINFLTVNSKQKGQIVVPNFGKENIALIIIPSTKGKAMDFTDKEPTRSFTFTVSALGDSIVVPPINVGNKIPAGFTFKNNLSFGQMVQDVIYLKVILADQGCVSNLTNTNYFGSATLAGVKCFQNKYKAAISAFAGYQIASTGLVGSGTRLELNSLLAK